MIFAVFRASMAYTTLNKMATVFINNLIYIRVWKKSGKVHTHANSLTHEIGSTLAYSINTTKSSHLNSAEDCCGKITSCAYWKINGRDWGTIIRWAERFYRAMLRSKARLCHRTSSGVSVCLSLTFRYVFHTGWNTSKIISPPNSVKYLHRLTSI